jgi:hypothetical protein
MSNTPINNIPYVPQNTLDPAAGLNLALNVIDALLNTRVINMTTTAPPGSPSNGDMYVVPTGATGVWLTHVGAVAQWVSDGSFWQYFAGGVQAFLVFNKADSNLYKWDITSSDWVLAAGIGEAPNDGRLYGRKSLTWVEMPDITHSVVSVNGATPDSSGDIQLAAASIPFVADSHSGLTSINVEDALNELGGRPSGSSSHIVVGAYASAPSTPASDGDMYQCTDCPLTMLGLSGAWVYFHKGQKIGLPSQLTTWMNQGTSVLTSFGPFRSITPQPFATANVRGYEKALPASSNYTVTIRLRMVGPNTSFANCGIYLRNATNGLMHVIAFVGRSATGSINALEQTIGVGKYSNVTTYNSDYLAPVNWERPDELWFRFKDDGANRISYISADGYTWLQLHTVGRTDFVTPDTVGFYADPENATASSNIIVTCLSYEESTP